ncbi:RNA ligase family protein [Priestia endophytica]
MKKYMKIIRHGKSSTHLTLQNDAYITITEKLDGANASFKREGNQILCFSRNNELNEENTLRGFYGWVQDNIKAEDLVEGVIYFGEWLVRHKLDYGENENKFYLFDTYNEETEKYLEASFTTSEADRLNLNLVPVFYEGTFQSMEHIQSFVGKSKLGEHGEGVVVKNVSYEDKHGVQQFTKFISDHFAEVKQVKKQRQAPTKDLLDEFVGLNLTTPRVDKMLHKLVDEEILQQDYDITDMGIILKNLGTKVYEDIIEEELDELLKHVKAKIGKKLPSIVKQVLVEQNRA